MITMDFANAKQKSSNILQTRNIVVSKSAFRQREKVSDSPDNESGRLMANLVEMVKVKHRANTFVAFRDIVSRYGIKPSTAHKLFVGSGVPKVPSLISLAKAAGVDAVSAVLSGGEVATNRSTAPIGVPCHVIGEVSGGAGVAHFDDIQGPRATYGDIRELIKDRSALWGHCHGDAALLTINGDSMEPRYADGSAIVIRRFSDGQLLAERDRTPAIVRIKSSDEYTFKDVQIVMGSGGKVAQILGIPINPNYPILTWRPSQVDITHLVVGYVEVQ